MNEALTKKDENYKKSQIFLNPSFIRSKDDNNMLDIPFFTRQIFERNKLRIRQLTFEDCFTDGKFKSLNQFRLIGLNLSNLVWLRLRNAITYAKKEMEKRMNVKKESKSTRTFLHSFKKGSKKFRTVLTFNLNKNLDRPNLRT
jgi:hypothetical protein